MSDGWTPATDQEMIEAVRQDHIVGRGTQSAIDECLTDGELLELLQEDKRCSERGAVRTARWYHRLWESNTPRSWISD